MASRTLALSPCLLPRRRADIPAIWLDFPQPRESRGNLAGQLIRLFEFLPFAFGLTKATG